MSLTVVNISRLETAVGASVSGAIADMAADALMVAVASDFGVAGSGTQVSDSENAGNYSTVVSRGGSVATVGIAGFYRQASVAGSGSSGNCSGGVGTAGLVCVFYEIGGASTSAAFVAGESTSATAGSTAPNPGSVTNSNSSAIFIAGMTDDQAASPIAYNINATGTVGTWSENTSSGRELDGNSYPAMGTVYQIVTSSASRTHVWGLGANSTSWYAINMVFSAPIGGAVARNTGYTRPLLGVGR